MKYLVLIPFFLLCTLLRLPADTIVLKDGTTYEGTILKEDATHYEMQVQITASIKDLKRIPKEDVASATKSTPDDEAFKAIAEILPVPDRQSPIRYDELIKGQVKPFLAAFPTSKHKAKAEEILATLEKERARVAKGDLKLDGRWIAAQDRAANAYEIDARITFGEMETAAEAGRYKEALRKYETIKEDFASSSYYEKAVELARKVLRSYGSALSSSVSQVDTAIMRRKAEMERLPNAQRSAALAEIERQDAAYLALVEREKAELKTRWLSINTYHKKPMEIVQRNITSTLNEMDRIDFTKIVDGGPLYRKAWSAVNGGDEEEIKEAIKELKSARIPARYVEGLENQVAAAEAAKAAAEEAAKAAEAARKAEAVAAAEEAEKMEKEAAEKEAAAKAEDAAGSGADSGSASESGDSPSATSGDEKAGGGGIKTILVFVMIAVLLVALGAMLLGKKKK